MENRLIVDFTGKYWRNYVSSEKRQEIDKYYYLYEYSNQIQLIIDNPQYPSMLNYIKTGLLTADEMLQALLHK